MDFFTEQIMYLFAFSRRLVNYHIHPCLGRLERLERLEHPQPLSDGCSHTALQNIPSDRPDQLQLPHPPSPQLFVRTVLAIRHPSSEAARRSATWLEDGEFGYIYKL